MPLNFAGEAFGVRKLACAFRENLENRAVFKSGGKLPHKAPSGRITCPDPPPQ
jgi:hypothetical protein